MPSNPTDKLSLAVEHTLLPRCSPVTSRRARFPLVWRCFSGRLTNCHQRLFPVQPADVRTASCRGAHSPEGHCPHPGAASRRRHRARQRGTRTTSSTARRDGRLTARPVYSKEASAHYYGVGDGDTGELGGGEEERRDGWEYIFEYPFEDRQSGQSNGELATVMDGSGAEPRRRIAVNARPAGRRDHPADDPYTGRQGRRHNRGRRLRRGWGGRTVRAAVLQERRA